MMIDTRLTEDQIRNMSKKERAELKIKLEDRIRQKLEALDDDTLDMLAKLFDGARK